MENQKLKLMTLRAKTSKAGRAYYSSQLGETSVVGFQAQDGSIEIYLSPSLAKPAQATNRGFYPGPKVTPRPQGAGPKITPRQQSQFNTYAPDSNESEDCPFPADEPFPTSEYD